MNYELKIKNYFLLFFIILILSIPLSAQQKDTELWTGASIDIPIWDGLSIEPGEQIRIDEGISHLKSAITDLSIKYKISKYFKVSTTYRLYVKPELPNHAFYLSGYFKYNFNPLELTYKLTYKKKFEEDNQTEEHIRNKLTLEYDLDKWIKPFAAYELFYRLNYKKGDRFDNYRFYLGFNIKINKDHEIQVYYLREEEINMKNPKRSDIIGLFYNIDSWF
jgi:hypothetical protein